MTLIGELMYNLELIVTIIRKKRCTECGFSLDIGTAILKKKIIRICCNHIENFDIVATNSDRSYVTIYVITENGGISSVCRRLAVRSPWTWLGTIFQGLWTNQRHIDKKWLRLCGKLMIFCPIEYILWARLSINVFFF